MSEQTLHFVPKPDYKRITKDRVVTLQYALFDDQGHAIEFRDDLVYLHGGYGGAFPKAEQALEVLEVGNKVDIELTAEDAFGPRHEILVIEAPLDDIPPEGRQVGVSIDGEGPDGHVVKFRVMKVMDDRIVLDGNHPLAGMDIRMNMEVLSIRKATKQELELGHAVRTS